MFEIEDSKLGRVRVVNVTEARSSIAAIMNDTQFNYIITKNNRPIRVIINYSLAHQSSGKTKENKVVGTSLKNLPITRGDEYKSSLSGLIGTREKDLKDHVAQKNVFDRAPEKISFSKSVMDLLIPDQKQVVEIEKPQESVELFPNSSQEFLEPNQDIIEEIPANNYWGQGSDNFILEEVVPSFEETPASELIPDLPEINPEPDEDLVIPQQGELEKGSDDYFDRYKKLYQPVPHAKNEAAMNLLQNQSPRNSEVVSEDVVSKENVFVEPVSLASQFAQGDASAEEAKKYFETSHHEVLVPNVPVAKPVVETKSASGLAMAPSKAHREPPSIQDLLRELENEKLSGEDDDFYKQEKR